MKKNKIAMVVGCCIIFAFFVFLDTKKQENEEYPAPSIVNADMMKVPQLKEQIAGAKICIVGEVIRGVELKENYTIPSEQLFGDTEEDYVMMENMKKDGLLPPEAVYQQYTIQPIQYVYNDTQQEKEEYDIIYPLFLQEYGAKPETGMKMILFLNPCDGFENKYMGEIAWAYYVDEEDNLIVTLNEDKIKEYKVKKLDNYIEKIRKFHDKK